MSPTVIGGRCYVNNARLSDVRFEVGEARCVVYAHRVVLAGASDVFGALLDPEPGRFSPAAATTAGTETTTMGAAPLEGAAPSADGGAHGGAVIAVPQFEPPEFLVAMRYAYGHPAPVDAGNVVAVVRVADYYGLVGLVRHCAERFRGEFLDGDNVVDALLELPYESWAAPLREAAIAHVTQNTAWIRGLARLPHDVISEIIAAWTPKVWCSRGAGLWEISAIELVCARIAEDPSPLPQTVIDAWTHQLLDRCQNFNPRGLALPRTSVELSCHLRNRSFPGVITPAIEAFYDGLCDRWRSHWRSMSVANACGAIDNSDSNSSDSDTSWSSDSE